MTSLRPFVSIASPHDDIVGGKLTEDVFAADLWDVFNGRGPIEYRDADVFFEKTYMTVGLSKLLESAERRLRGSGENPVIQLQTPFGGGKTHALIALYHKAKREWGANVVVIVGIALDPVKTTLWGEMERQLTGYVNKFSNPTPPGREDLRSLLEAHQPLLILVDEILGYVTKAAGVKVGDSNMAEQVLVFIHTLTEVVKSLDRSLMVITLPTSNLETYGEVAEKYFQRLQKILGRVEKVYTPVEDREIFSVVRQRLFKEIDKSAMRKVIDAFINHAERERLLPVDKSEYRKKLEESYPFLPEVVEVLYHKWGSFPTFQRTRGVLRLLSLVVRSLMTSRNPLIRPSDFDLSNREIRNELVKHIGNQFESVIASDITGDQSAARQVDESLGSAYKPYRLGSKTATAIFLYSFTGAGEAGASPREIKLACAEVDLPSGVVEEAVRGLENKAFYLHRHDDRYYFTTAPNLNRILVSKMENVSAGEMAEEERKMVEDAMSKKRFRVIIWPQKTEEVPDDRELKLVVLDTDDKSRVFQFLENYGQRPRVHRNTLIFLCPVQNGRVAFDNVLREKIAWEKIERDQNLKLPDHQKNTVKERLRDVNRLASERLRDLYKLIYLPARDRPEEIYLSPSEKKIDEAVWDKLRREGKIVEKLDPLRLREKYLKEDYIEVRRIIDLFYNTPGEIRITSEDVVKGAVKRGVEDGIFGYGVLEGETPVCKHFREEIDPPLKEGDVIIKPELCEKSRPTEEPAQQTAPTTSSELVQPPPPQPLSSPGRITPAQHPTEVARPTVQGYTYLDLVLVPPAGTVSNVVKLINDYIKKKFNNVEIKIEILARNGKITQDEYSKIEETIRQLGIKVEKEEKR